MHCASCNVLRTSCNVQCSVFWCIVHRAGLKLNCILDLRAMCNVQCFWCIVLRASCRFEVELKCALVFVHCAVCSVFGALYFVHRAVCSRFEIELHFRPSCNVHCALCSVQCAVCSVQCASCIKKLGQFLDYIEYFYIVLV